MAPTLTVDAAPTGPAPADATVRRAKTSRSTLPSGRAVVGGLLVTVASLGAYLAATSGERTPGDSYVVATAAIDPGQTLGADDVVLATGDLPDDLEASAFASLADLQGAVALAPLAPGSLVQRPLVRTDAAGAGGDPAPEVSMRLPRDQAVGGALVRGERVDVLATYGSGGEATTHVVARGVLVTHVGGNEDATLGDDGGTTLTLRFADDAAVLSAIHAKDVALVTLVRSPDGRPDAADRPDRYAGPGDEP